jgi:hypothetical protein
MIANKDPLVAAMTRVTLHDAAATEW